MKVNRTLALSNYVLAMAQFAVMQNTDMSYFLRQEVLDALQPDELGELRKRFPNYKLLFEGVTLAEQD